ncbi:unnamed protein product [Protopolystoma xenopodis]|uniref:Uncharacterized protein n=1 Tax=Protopolystoma xenopodis TaxID=117903 RepID=A0A448WZZ7_9PLAT|nr:unnamed protein product [Protopolystoma xenopodis]
MLELNLFPNTGGTAARQGFALAARTPGVCCLRKNGSVLMVERRYKGTEKTCPLFKPAANSVLRQSSAAKTVGFEVKGLLLVGDSNLALVANSPVNLGGSITASVDSCMTLYSSLLNSGEMGIDGICRHNLQKCHGPPDQTNH